MSNSNTIKDNEYTGFDLESRGSMKGVVRYLYTVPNDSLIGIDEIVATAEEPDVDAAEYEEEEELSTVSSVDEQDLSEYPIVDIHSFYVSSGFSSQPYQLRVFVYLDTLWVLCCDMFAFLKQSSGGSRLERVPEYHTCYVSPRTDISDAEPSVSVGVANKAARWYNAIDLDGISMYLESRTKKPRRGQYLLEVLTHDVEAYYATQLNAKIPYFAAKEAAAAERARLLEEAEHLQEEYMETEEQPVMATPMSATLEKVSDQYSEEIVSKLNELIALQKIIIADSRIAKDSIDSLTNAVLSVNGSLVEFGKTFVNSRIEERRMLEFMVDRLSPVEAAKTEDSPVTRNALVNLTEEQIQACAEQCANNHQECCKSESSSSEQNFPETNEALHIPDNVDEHKEANLPPTVARDSNPTWESSKSLFGRDADSSVHNVHDMYDNATPVV